MDKYDSSQLTEFPRFEEESTQSGVSTFFNKLWKFPIFSPSETLENLQNKALMDDKQSIPQSEEPSKQEDDDLKTETGAYAVEFEGRSLQNVLKRISSLVALGSGGGTRYADTELARYWMPDDISRECYECAARFSALRRRHHCRVCGQIFCSRCCSQRVPGQIFGCAGGLRVCTYCCNVVLSYLRENEDMSTDLRTLQDNLQVKFPDNKSQAALSRDNFVFAREQDDRGEARGSPQEALQDVFKQLSFTLPTQHHRYRLVRYNGVWRGCDVLQWVMDNTNNKTRVQATMVCQNLLNAGYMDCMTELPRFADYALYKPIVLPPRSVDEEADSPEECKRMAESVSSYCLDLNLGESSARLVKATKTDTKSSPSSEDENPVLDHSEGYTESKNICKAIVESGEDHLRLLMRQCLAREGLSATWLDVLYPLCQQAAEITMPDLYCNDIDVRNYVQVKKVPGGSARDSCVVQGVVLTKNVAHRGMPQQISNPTVLLLDCSIAYQRVEGKLTSLEPVLMQEQEYLVRCAARITALRPRVVLVRGSAARPVQDALRLEGVALASGVPERALRRAARCARAEIVTSIDARIGMPRLGTCRNFYVKDYSSKTLMVLEGCSEPHLGCCVLLRGASLQELVRVKKVVKFMLLACYNWKLEKAFLGDIEAILPEPGMTFDDDNDNDVFNDKNDLTKTNEHKDGATVEMYDELINESFGANEKKYHDLDSTVVDTDLTEDTKTNDSVAITNDSIAKTDDSIAKTDDSTAKTNDSIAKTSDIMAKTSESVAKTSDSMAKTNASVAKTNDSITKFDDELKKTAEIEDPLQRAKTFVRKADSDKNLSCGVPIRDFSDPLRATLSVDDDVGLPKIEAKLKADDTHGDRWCSDDVVLSMSPNVIVPAPYLETEAGRRCPLRAHFPRPLLPAPPPAAPHTPRATHRTLSRTHSHVAPKESHPFIEQPITSTPDDPAVRAALAHYRATACRPTNNKHKPECPLYKPSVVRKVKEPAAEPDKQGEGREPLDPLSPENHQQISLLLYSYSNKSANVPDFCVNPWIATMEMYGKHDISVGAFLEKYCFDGEYKCTSAACHVPMNQHTRRFVHGDVCITITCNTVGHSTVDKLSEEQTKQVMFWSRCESCGAVGRTGRLSRGALALSLAQYVRVRCGAPRYVRARACAHPLHAHAHAFVSRLTTACFRFSKISTYDIELPPDVISTRYDTKQMRDALINQLNELMLKGHETFTGVTDTEAERDYQTFKQHMEQIHLALTSSHLQEQTTLAAVVRSLWSVSDRIISGEKMLRDAQDKWSSPMKPTKPQPDPTVEEKSDVEDSSGDVGNDSSGTEEDEEKGDKKTVRQILSQLLSNNQPSNQCGMIVSSGLVPVVVMAGEIGSVIAATLASVTYQRTMRAHKHSIQTEHEEAESSPAAAGKEKADAERARAGRAGDHVEVLLKDGLLCRVYYAPQFQKLRHMLLAPLGANPHIADRFAAPGGGGDSAGGGRCCPDDGKEKSENKSLCEIEEGFIRSLAHCVPWAARGGKSGSTFCKTKDDRYVLKEMTKPEWQQFLEFAPHYFSYVTNCHQNKWPSLLARILGVYSVGGAGNGVLVMENVWYGCGARDKRFDLKGSSRHRLTDDSQPLAVLMDENLLNLRWETQLYVQSHVGSVLWACVERDTDFLAANGVMDYSLLLGIGRHTLVLGVIDYIRTFTWDKKLEHLVKKNLGSGQPTVVSPEQYKRRFFAACRKYFLQCPAHWDHLYQTIHA